MYDSEIDEQTKLAKQLSKLANIENREEEVVRRLKKRLSALQLEKRIASCLKRNDPNRAARRHVYQLTGIISTYDIKHTLCR